MARTTNTKRAFGSVRKLPSGRYQARYTGPDGAQYKAPRTYEAKDDAVGWLRAEQKLIELETWQPLAAREKQATADAMTVKELIDIWLANAPLKESTKQSHRRKLNSRVLRASTGTFDSLADVKVSELDRPRVRLWWTQVQATWPDQGNTNATAYKRLHTALNYAVNELELIKVNPVNIPGAGRVPRPENRDRPLLSLSEAALITENMPERLKIATLLLCWSGLRLGELLELRRKDLIGLNKKSGTLTLRVRRNAQRVTDPTTNKQVVLALATPKSDAGNRDIVLPETVATALREHAAEHMDKDPEALVVTTLEGQQMLDTNFRNRFNRAVALAGRADITPHDLRRFYGTQLVTKANVSLEEARRLMGHETVDQLMEYQRAAQGYETRAAEALNGLL